MGSYNFVQMCAGRPDGVWIIRRNEKTTLKLSMNGAMRVDKTQAEHGEWLTAKLCGEMVEMHYKDGYKELWETNGDQLVFLKGMANPKAEAAALAKAHAELHKFF